MFIAKQVKHGLLLIDAEDAELLFKHSWHSYKNQRSNTGYMSRTDRTDGVKTTVILHREIMKFPPMPIDHINGDGLDNRRGNLRVCSHAENKRNSQKYKNCSSKYKGVSKFRSKWKAELRFNGINIYLGLFISEIDAAHAYNNKAKELYGEFAKLNEV